MPKINLHTIALLLFTLIVKTNATYAQLVWTAQNSGTTTQFIDKVDFVDVNTGFTLMYPDKILSTTNGGSTWTPYTVAGADFNALSFVDTQTGWAIDYANASIYKTTNGGATWNSIYTNPNFIGYAYDIHFVDANYGWAIRTDLVLFTNNGGASWDSISSPGGASINFVDQLNGFILNGNFLYKSTNGGTIWNPSTIWTGSEYMNGFCCVNTMNIWAVGDNGLIRHSINGGSSWITNNLGTYGVLHGVRFFDANNGIIVGNGGLILTTNDGGLTWITNTSTTGSDLYQLDMVSPDKVWVTGSGGTILSSNADTDITIESYDGNTQVCPGSTVVIGLNVKNNGTSPITSGNFTLNGTAGSFLNYNWTGLVQPGIVTLIDIGTLLINVSETFTVNFTGDYVVTNNSFDFSINITGAPISISGPHLICPTDSATIFASGGSVYIWTGVATSGYDSSITVSPTSSTYYPVSIADSFGCTVYDSIYVEINTTCDDTLSIDSLVINNAAIAITPNDDGKNDFLFLDGVENTINTVTIFNRWGDIIASFDNYNNADIVWHGDGSDNSPVTEGTYFFTLEIPASNSFSSGWVQVIR